MAGRFPAAWLDELRSRADIVQIISAYTPLKKNGRKHWGLCPFHGEKTASFSVDAESQLYYCFGCKASGSVITFVMEMERLEFPEAVRFLADRLNMPLPEMENSPEQDRNRELRMRLLAANKEAARFYHQTLFKPEGKPMLDYLRKRGLDDAVIRKFGLGAAPNEWDAATRYLTGLGYTVDELRLAGLTVVKEAEPATETDPGRPRRMFDMFRNRAIFPIIDQHGNVLAFGGRTLGDGQPKYLNTSDTPVFNKRHNVYAANLLRKERGLDHVILVEGYMDVVSLTQFGVKGVCATLGTALTNEQARLIRRFAPKVYLSYDGDSAGQHAILRGLDIMAAEDIPCRVLDYPDNLDPDEYIRRDGPEGFASLPAISGVTYRMRRFHEQFDMTTEEGRTDYVKVCAPYLKNVEPVELENYVQQLTMQTGFSREVILAQIGWTSAAASPKQQAAGGIISHPAPRRPEPIRPPQDASGIPLEDQRAQETLISLVATRRIPADIAAKEDFSDPLLKHIFVSLSEGRSPASLLEEEMTDDMRTRIAGLLQSPPSENTDQTLQMAQDCLNRLRFNRIQTRLAEITKTIGTLQGAARSEAINEFRKLSDQQKQYRPG